MAVLNGNFKSNKGENGTRSIKFFQDVCQELPDAIMISNEKQIMTKVNKSANRIFGDSFMNNIIDKPLTEFISNSSFKGDMNNLLNSQPHKPIIEQISYLSNETNTTISIQATSIIINESIRVVFRDITQTVRYNKLIEEEKYKSDKLLGIILPSSLVPLVQAGEKNISFAVQSATIVFMDIVSFTPWCDSLPAEKAMSTLNLLFMKNDKCIAK